MKRVKKLFRCMTVKIESRVARTSDGLSHLNTVIVREPKIYAYWQSPTFFEPVADGWYVHVPSVAGSNQPVRSKGAEWRWEHSEVAAEGLTTLKLYEER